MSMNYKPYITRDPSVCGGEPVITGTRITVRTLLASLAEGMSNDEILLDFPTLSQDALRAVVAFAAISGEEVPQAQAQWSERDFSQLSLTQAMRGMEEPDLYGQADLKERW